MRKQKGHGRNSLVLFVLIISAKPGWSWGCVSAIDSNGRTIWIADAHRGDGIFDGVYRSRNDYSPESDDAAAALWINFTLPRLLCNYGAQS